MKLKKQLVKRNIAGDVILVPVGDSSLTLKGLMTLNETAEFIWDSLKEDITEEEILKLILLEYDVEEALAKKDLDEFISVLKEKDLLDL